MIYIVSSKRFELEYSNHVVQVPNKNVNWYVEPDTGYIRFYITASNSTETFCYLHKTGTDTLPYTIRDMMTEKGMVLGIIEPISQSGSESEMHFMAQQLKIGVMPE